MRVVLFLLPVAILVVLVGSLVASRHQHPVSLLVATPGMSKGPIVKPIIREGIYTNEPYLPSEYEIIAWFSRLGEPLVNNKFRYACERNLTVLITWESWGGLDDIISGKNDNLIVSSLQEAYQSCPQLDMIIRLNHEMDGVGWYPWQSSPGVYIEAWRRVIDLGRQVNPNIKWLWSPNQGTERARLFYPGSEWLDYVGLTLNYVEGGTYLQNQDVIESFGKPVIIGETSRPELINVVDSAIIVVVYFDKQDLD